jgi:hypothetical protein
MNSYQITIWALAGGLLASCLRRRHRRRGLSGPRTAGRSGAASGWPSPRGSAAGLHHGYALELALRTGLHDMRQAVLAVPGCHRLPSAAICSGVSHPEGAGFGDDPVETLIVHFGTMLGRRLISKPTPTASGRGARAARVRSK